MKRKYILNKILVLFVLPVILFFCFTPNLYAYRFEKIVFPNKFTQNKISCLTYDQQGFLLVGSRNGLWAILLVIAPIVVVLVLHYYKKRQSRLVVVTNEKVSDEDLTEIPEPEKYFIDKLADYMDKEQPYLNPDITLKDLAKLLNMTHNHLSSIINDYMHKNFYDLINTYRVNHVKELLGREDTTRKLTLLSIGFDSGFNSKSTFYRIFKKHTGMTPSEYLKTIVY